MYTVRHKKRATIFDYNSSIYGAIFTLSIPVETGRVNLLSDA